MGTDHVGTLSLAYKLSDSLVFNIKHCVFKQVKQMELIVSSGNGENPPEIQVPRHQPRANLAGRPFKGHSRHRIKTRL